MRRIILAFSVLYLLNCSENEVVKPNDEIPVNGIPSISWETLHLPLGHFASEALFATAVNSNNEVFIGTNDGRIMYSLPEYDKWIELKGANNFPISFIIINSQNEIFYGYYPNWV